MKIIIFLFLSNFLYTQEININFNILYKKECLKINDSLLNFKESKIPYLNISITNHSNHNLYLDINLNTSNNLFDYESEYYNYSFMLHSLYENKEPKYNYNIKKLNETFVFEQNCNFDFFIFDLKNENNYKKESYELGNNDAEFSFLNFLFKIQQKLDYLKTNKQIKLFNFKNKETITYLEAFKIYRNDKLKNIKNINNIENRIYLKPKESIMLEKSLIIQKIYGGKYIFKYNSFDCDLKENIVFENETYYFSKKISSNELIIDF